jgi:transposase-like protein
MKLLKHAAVCITIALLAIRETLGEEVEHRCNQSLNNHLEQDHRGITQR